jgi:hypothetical protein
VVTVVNPWARHFQLVWEERAGDPRLPYWLRVAALAYGKHATNGHAVFKAGQIGLILGTPNPATGEFKPLEKGNVQRAIRTAVEYGWLSKESGSRCLVVPGHAINGGVGGRELSACPQHDKKREVVSERPRLVPKVVS